MTPAVSIPLSDLGSSPPYWLGPEAAASIASICKTAARFFDVPVRSLFLQRRGIQRVSTARQFAMAAVREQLAIPLESVGQIFADRDHCTVIHAVKAVRRHCKADPKLNALFLSLVTPGEFETTTPN